MQLGFLCPLFLLCQWLVVALARDYNVILLQQESGSDVDGDSGGDTNENDNKTMINCQELG